MILYALTALLAITQLGDWFTTRTILKEGGKELNSVMVKLFSIFGIDLTLLAKAVAVTVAGYYAGVGYMPVLVVLTAFYVVVVIHNALQLRK